MIFVSHANPEDNEFTRWITLQLANEGYPVWCDLTKLLGGEPFWEDIQTAIKDRTTKFLFVLSSPSNSKKGTLDELDCALGVARKRKLTDFIIPLKIDKLEYDDVYIGIRRLISVSFTDSWAQGLYQLLKKLQDSNVPKDANFKPEAVCSWWRSNAEYSAERGLLQEPDEHLSNWYRFKKLPEIVFHHYVSRRNLGQITFDTDSFQSLAARDSAISFVSFARSQELESQLPFDHYISKTEEIPIETAMVDWPLGYSRQLNYILRKSWENFVSGCGLVSYEMSNRSKSFYFRRGQVKDDRLFFTNTDNEKKYREVVGYSTRNERLRYWHYAVSGKPDFKPIPHFIVKGHVLFSNDGLKIWESKENLAKARRSQCKNWWNDEWRDRMLAVINELRDGDGGICLKLAEGACAVLDARPHLFVSPVSYVQLEEAEDADLNDYEFEEEDDEFEEGDDIEDL
jgi:TIR domain-containing protein